MKIISIRNRIANERVVRQKRQKVQRMLSYQGIQSICFLVRQKRQKQASAGRTVFVTISKNQKKLYAF